MRLKLPLIESIQKELEKPTVRQMREQLGGRDASPPDCGQVVLWVSSDGGSREGVILAAQGEDRLVWTSEGVVRKVPKGNFQPLDGIVSLALSKVAGELRAFAALQEGQWLSIPLAENQPPTDVFIVEKCRFGALVAREDDTVLGLGFRKLIQ